MKTTESKNNAFDYQDSIEIELVNGKTQTKDKTIPESAPKAAQVVKMGAKSNEVQFPRTDNYFRTKSSLSYQEVYSRVWQHRKKGRCEDLTELLCFIVLGIMVGLVGFGMDVLEMLLVYYKDKTMQAFIDEKDGEIKAWLFYSLYGAGLCVVSCILTTWWGTGAMGSGVAEIIGYVNGVNYPECISIKTAITKIVGVVLAVAGGLTVGKEGPLAHIGGNLGAATAYIPGMAFLRNDWKKR